VRKIIVALSAAVMAGADKSIFFTRVKILVIAVPFVPKSARGLVLIFQKKWTR
jgi:hypothetical protein